MDSLNSKGKESIINLHHQYILAFFPANFQPLISFHQLPLDSNIAFLLMVLPLPSSPLWNLSVQGGRGCAWMWPVPQGLRRRRYGWSALLHSRSCGCCWRRRWRRGGALGQLQRHPTSWSCSVHQTLGIAENMETKGSQLWKIHHLVLESGGS